MESKIQLGKSDARRLRSMLAAQQRTGHDRNGYALLHDEVDRAALVDDDALPASVVAIGSTVVVFDLRSGSVERYTVVLPDQADIAQRRISVLAPLGTALLGARVGDIVEWDMPGGPRRLSIEAVQRSEDSSVPIVRMSAQLGRAIWSS
jgi:regulator of nucleoside diphosphate kinase